MRFCWDGRSETWQAGEPSNGMGLYQDGGEWWVNVVMQGHIEAMRLPIDGHNNIFDAARQLWASKATLVEPKE